MVFPFLEYLDRFVVTLRFVFACMTVGIGGAEKYGDCIIILMQVCGTDTVVQEQAQRISNCCRRSILGRAWLWWIPFGVKNMWEKCYIYTIPLGSEILRRGLGKLFWLLFLLSSYFCFYIYFYYFIIIIFLLTISNINVCKDWCLAYHYFSLKCGYSFNLFAINGLFDFQHKLVRKEELEDFCRSCGLPFPDQTSMEMGNELLKENQAVCQCYYKVR